MPNILNHAPENPKAGFGLQLAPSTCEVVVLVSRALVGGLTTYPLNLAKLCARIPLRGPKIPYNLASQLVQLDHNGTHMSVAPKGYLHPCERGQQSGIIIIFFSLKCKEQ